MLDNIKDKRKIPPTKDKNAKNDNKQKTKLWVRMIFFIFHHLKKYSTIMISYFLATVN